ncbi:hypothetical protein ACIBJC_15225 [Streptomyces sp. NPDC050509]|uniref:hypothetical protein n=1 Tax=Streptomyces sp. NPDC050509 TaxID=3365620 RepID=UPI003787A42A
MKRLWRSEQGERFIEPSLPPGHTAGPGQWLDREGDGAPRWMVGLLPAAQDPDTGRWSPRTDLAPTQIPLSSLTAPAWTEVSPDPRADERIARLADLVATLLADYQRDTGAPCPYEGALAVALEDVAFIPTEGRRRAQSRARNAARG